MAKFHFHGLINPWTPSKLNVRKNFYKRDNMTDYKWQMLQLNKGYKIFIINDFIKDVKYFLIVVFKLQWNKYSSIKKEFNFNLSFLSSWTTLQTEQHFQVRADAKT